MKTKSSKILLQKRLKKKAFVKAYREADFLTYIGLSVAQCRDRVNLTQGQLAKKLKTTQSVISRIENGNQNLSVAMLVKIAKVLKCELSFTLKPANKIL